AGGDGVEWRGEADLLSLHPHDPLVGLDHPVEDLHQGGLARAALAADGADLALLHDEVYGVGGHDTGKARGYAEQSDRSGHPSPPAVRTGPAGTRSRSPGPVKLA